MSQSAELLAPLAPTPPKERSDTARPPAMTRRSAARPGLAASWGQALEERRLFVLTPFLVIAGLIASLLPVEPPDPKVLVTGGAALAIAAVLGRHSLRVGRIILCLASFWLGFSLFAIHGQVFGTAMLARPAYGTFEARVSEIISKIDGEQRLIVSDIVPTGNAKPVPMRRARIFVRTGPDLEPGDLIRAGFRFYPVPGPALPGAFDAQFHGYFAGIGAYATTTSTPEIIEPGASTLPARMIENVRSGIARRIDAVLPQPSAGVARAIINGDQSAVTEWARQVMSTAGLAHVLSISGLHLTLVAGGVYFTLRMLLVVAAGTRRPYPAKRLAAVGGMAAALLYYAISGGNVAALRSTIMILLVFGAISVGRRALTMRNVAIAGLLVILSDPASVFRPSFQLSFSAVIALVGAYEGYRPRGGEKHWFKGLVSYFLGIAGTSVVAGAATVLFSVYHFQQTSPLSVIGNLVTLPLVGFVMMPAALLGVLAMPFGLEGLPLVVMGWSIDAMLGCAALVADLSENLNASPLLTPLSLVIGLAALAWFSFLRTRWRLLGPAVALPMIILFAVDRPPDVLVADTTQAVAVRTEEGLALASGKAKSFSVMIWSDTYAQQIEAMQSGLACDKLACIARAAPGFSVSVVKSPDAFGEDCANVDLVVTRLYAPAYCRRETQVIDAADLRVGGVQWLRWTGGGFDLRPAIPQLNRPWRAALR